MTSNYIICSTQRSGSTYFCECLSRIQLLGRPDEWLVFLELPNEFLGPDDVALKEKKLPEIVEARSGKQETLSGAKTCGWKIMWSTMALLDRTIFAEGGRRLDGPALAELFHQPKYIYFERVNKLSQAISHAILQKTGVSHVKSSAEENKFREMKEKLSITNNDITSFLKKVLIEESKWQNFFAGNKITPLKVYYEDFCNDVEEGVRSVMQFLDCPPSEEVLARAKRKGELRKTRSEFELNLARRYLMDLAK